MPLPALSGRSAPAGAASPALSSAAPPCGRGAAARTMSASTTVSDEGGAAASAFGRAACTRAPASETCPACGRALLEPTRQRATVPYSSSPASRPSVLVRTRSSWAPPALAVGASFAPLSFVGAVLGVGGKEPNSGSVGRVHGATVLGAGPTGLGGGDDEVGHPGQREMIQVDFPRRSGGKGAGQPFVQSSNGGASASGTAGEPRPSVLAYAGEMDTASYTALAASGGPQALGDPMRGRVYRYAKRSYCRGGCNKSFARPESMEAHWATCPDCEVRHAAYVRGTPEGEWFLSSVKRRLERAQKPIRRYRVHSLL